MLRIKKKLYCDDVIFLHYQCNTKWFIPKRQKESELGLQRGHTETGPRFVELFAERPEKQRINLAIPRLVV